ncbi:MAG: M48 family metallopeptidase [Synergistaceae bacterium]|nr:M48 family metallopeptidase [Synergistaceae bacterium]
MKYKIIRSKRKTLAIEISLKNGFVVRSPLRVKREDIDKFVNEHEEWIKNKLAKINEIKNIPTISKLNSEEISFMKEQARKIISEQVKNYSQKIGVSFGKITIRSQRSRWGSCSSKGNLNFNFLLMLTPPDVLNSVIVHEVCHLKEMNHSENFYALVLSICPNYWEAHAWLRENGSKIMARLDD